MGRGVSFANAFKNSGLAYRIGLVDMVVQVVDLNIVRGPEGWRTWVIITEFANLKFVACINVTWIL